MTNENEDVQNHVQSTWSFPRDLVPVITSSSVLYHRLCRSEFRRTVQPATLAVHTPVDDGLARTYRIDERVAG